MRNKLLGFVLLGAAAGFALAACGEEEGGPTTCAADGDCATGEVCHPLAKVCVTGCTTGNDCPSESKNCDSITVGGTHQADGGMTGGTTSAKFCQCSTTALCGGGENPEIICAAEDKICVTKCTSDGQCGAGRKCEAGDCKTTMVVHDAGTTDAGTCSWGTCSSTSDTTGAMMCGASGCAAGATCSGIGLSTCSAGSSCVGGACGYPPRPANSNTGEFNCVNFYSGSHASGPAWVPGTSTGPVIFQISEVSHGPGEYDGGTACPGTSSTCNGQCPVGDTQFNVRFRAYRTDTTWPATRAGLSGLFYVPTSGTDQDIIGAGKLRPNVGYNTATECTPDCVTNEREFNTWHCLAGTANAFQPGFYFTNGNEICRQLP